MSKETRNSISMADFPLWREPKKRVPFAFYIELTARCNYNCRHCYIRMGKQSKVDFGKELSLEEIRRIADEAISMGALWCFLTGGEPLLRDDFPDIYEYLKRKGLMVSISTNGALLSRGHIQLFRKYPPRDIEITVYGASRRTYEYITRSRGSYCLFKKGLRDLNESRIGVRLKAMIIKSNIHEFADISKYCRDNTKDYYRFDPFLQLRYDRCQIKNKIIKEERLSPAEIAGLEASGGSEFLHLRSHSESGKNFHEAHKHCNHLFNCNTGMISFAVSSEGYFHLCPSLWHPSTICDLRKVSLRDAWYGLAPQVRNLRVRKNSPLQRCKKCQKMDLCQLCPAISYLETGEMDSMVEYYCEVAREREALRMERNMPTQKADRTINRPLASKE